MLYQEYEKKIKKVAEVKAKIYRFRFLIASGLLVLVTGISLLVGLKGTISTSAVTRKEFVYGEAYSFGATSFMNSVTWEYKQEGKTTWSNDKPIDVGAYVARACSKNSFGANTYGDEIKYSIIQKDLKLKFKNDIVTYGDIPAIKIDGLVTGDKIERYDVIYASPYSLESDVTVDISSLKIVNEQKSDVIKNYHIESETKCLSVAKRSLSFTMKRNDVEYNGEYQTLTQDDYDMKGKLADGDRLVFNCLNSFKDIGAYSYEIDVKIYNRDDLDVTHMYSMSFNTTSRYIHSRNITLTSPDLIKTYDGKPFEEEKFVEPTIINGSILPNHRMTYSYYSEYYYLTCDMCNQFDICIYDENNVNVTFTYYSLSYQYGSFKINKRNITITNNNHTYTYGDSINLNKVNNDITVEQSNGDRGLASTDKVTVTNYESIAQPIAVNEYTLCPELKISNSISRSDVTYCYLINHVEGYLTIEKRDITVTIEAGEFVYDGQVHSTNTYISSGSLVNGEKLGANVIQSDRVCSESVSTIVDSIHIFNEASLVDTTYCYNIKVIVLNDYLTISPRQISVDIPNLDTIYASKNIESPYMITDGSLVEGETLTINRTEKNGLEPFHVGHYEFDISVNIVNVDCDDVTDCYDINLTNGNKHTIDIRKEQLYIASKGSSKIYDGTPIVNNYENDDYDVQGLKGNDYLTFGSIVTSDSAIGTYPIQIGENFSIQNSIYGFDVTQDYECHLDNSNKFEIKKRPLEVQMNLEKIYDGKPFTSEDYLIVGEYDLILGHQLSIKFTNNHTHVWENEDNFLSNCTFRITDSYGNDYTRNYDIRINSTKTTVNKRPITIKTPDTEKVYDGTPIIPDTNCTITGGLGLAEGDVVTYTYEFQPLPTNVNDTYQGSWLNVLDATITNKDGCDVTEDYDITWDYGTLTINPVELKVTCPASIIEYDGQSHEINYSKQEITGQKNNFFISEGNLPDGFKMYGSFFITAIEHGTYRFGQDINICDPYNNPVDLDNFDITYLGGFLLIAARKLTLTTLTTEVAYKPGQRVENKLWISEGSLVEDHILFRYETKHFIDPGEYSNDVFEIKILVKETNEDVTSNYDIVWDYGHIRIYE